MASENRAPVWPRWPSERASRAIQIEFDKYWLQVVFETPYRPASGSEKRWTSHLVSDGRVATVVDMVVFGSFQCIAVRAVSRWPPSI